MNFNLGDTVLCINDHNHLTLHKGTLYTIQEILACKNCQEAVVDVGLNLKNAARVIIAGNAIPMPQHRLAIKTLPLPIDL